jgi:hypothetical protein
MVGAIVMPQIAKNALENTFDIPQVSSLWQWKIDVVNTRRLNQIYR